MPFSFLFAALLSPAALATDWTWDDEVGLREWHPDSLDWASAVHPNHPDPALIAGISAPPPREMWCVGDNNPPNNTDLDTFDDLLTDWLHDYLDIPDQDPLPMPLSVFPAEC
jgi:hypothetical protein